MKTTRYEYALTLEAPAGLDELDETGLRTILPAEVIDVHLRRDHDVHVLRVVQRAPNLADAITAVMDRLSLHVPAVEVRGYVALVAQAPAPLVGA